MLKSRQDRPRPIRRRAKRRTTPLLVERLEARMLLAAAPDGLVSWYRAEGDATDSAGSNDGVLENGTGFTAGKVGQAFLFDGSDDQIRVADDDIQDPGSGFTVEAWVNLSESGHGRTIAQKRSDGNVGGYTFETSHDIGVNGLQFVIWLNNTQTFLRTPAGVLTNGTWQHVAATYNGMAMRIFVDGVEKASGSASGPVDNSDEDVIIGRNAVIGSFAWKGAIDEWSFYNRALAPTEIQTVFTAGSAGKSAAIVVTTTADEDNGSAAANLGAGTSLREAIDLANATPGEDKIHFNIPGTGPHTISPLSGLPAITQPVRIDGYTQPGASANTMTGGNDAVILIELDGTNAGEEADGLVLASGGSTVSGLAIGRFGGSGIRVARSDNVIAGNFLGTDATGNLDRGNGEGVTLVGAENAGAPLYSNDFEGTIGAEWSTTATDVTPIGDRRFLGQFGNDTVTLTLDADSIDQDNTTAITVEFDLFVIRTWDGNHTGGGSGPDRWSLTLGNGMSLLDTTFSNDHPNSGFAGQAYPGVFGSGQFGPQTGASEVNALGFLFGNDEFDSVYHLSFTFSYTGGDLVLKFGAGLTTPGDDESWGLDNMEVRAVAQAASAPNDFSLASNPNGDWTYGWTATLGGTLHPYPNAVTAANGIETWIDNAIQQAGAPAVAYNPTTGPISTCCTIQPGQINFHPGPGGEQSVVRWTAPADDTVNVAALFVGIDGSPTTTDAHVLHNGVSLFDGVVNRLYAGPYYETTLAVQAGDTIDFVVGTGGNGFISDSTALDAVIRSATTAGGGAAERNVIGGTSVNTQNVIAFNGGDGVRTTTENATAAILGNSIFANGAAGIDLAGDGFPLPAILTLANFPGELALTGSLDAEASANYRIEFFASDSPDPSGFGEGQRLLGVRRLTTDSSGHAAFGHELPPVGEGQWITATATRELGGGEAFLETSEFSAAIQAIAEEAGADLEVTIADSPDPILIGDSVTYTITATNNGPDAATGVIVVSHGPAGQPFNSVTIPVGGLTSGASHSFQLVFTPAEIGSFSVTASVTAGEDDPDPANNSFTATTIVEPRSTFELEQARYEVREGEAFAVLTVRRTGGLSSSAGASVEFETIDGTAGQRGIRTGLTRVDDFTTTSGTLFFRSRSNVATIRVPIGDDNLLESDEIFRVVLSNPSAGTRLGAISSAEVVIHDNDPSVSFFAASSERNEAVAGRGPIEVRLRPASDQTVTVAYAAAGGSAIAGTDFSLVGSSLTFRPGETRKFIQFSNVNDTLFEGNETAFIELSSPTNAFLGETVRHRVTIVDNDPQPPNPDPGGTIQTALFIDLQTLPRQVYRQFIGRTELDTFRVELGPKEHLALDVDPGLLGTALPNSRLTIMDENGAPLASVGASPEPESGLGTNNAATLFQADADGGTYYVQLSTTAAAKSYGYSLGFHRIGVSENVPTPEKLNVAGSMYAWFEPNASDPSKHVVGITGPTGYGFTLAGPWQHQVQASGRSVLKSQTMTLAPGDRFTLTSPELGVEIPLLASNLITISTVAQRWGDVLGVVSKPFIDIPMSLDIAPINDLLADVFGSNMASVGALFGAWRISLGGSVYFENGRNKTAPVDEMLAGIPYLRQRGPIKMIAQFGPIVLDFNVIDTPIEWIFDPADPMLYVKVAEIGRVKDAALAISLHGLIEYVPQDAPNPLIDAGVTQFYGQIYGTANVPFQIGPLPMEVEAEVVLNVDADRDGLLLGDLRDVADVFDILQGDFSEVREIVNDVQLGANGTLVMSLTQKKGDALPPGTYTMEAGRASVVLDGLAETIWVRGQQGGDALSPEILKKLNSSSKVVTEGIINWDGDFLLATTTTNSAGGVTLEYGITFTNDGIFARVTGSIEWSAKIDYLAGTVSGKAKATIEANIAIEFDGDGAPHMSGSISASGKLSAKINGSNKTLFNDSISSRVRDKGFRFDFPLGVGNLDFDLF